MEAKFLVEAADTPLTPEGTRLVRGAVSAFEWGSLGKWGETQELPLPPGAVSVPLPEEALPRLRLSAWEVEDGIYRMEARLAFSLEGGEREVLVFSKSGDIGDYAQHTASREALTDGDREEILGALESFREASWLKGTGGKEIQVEVQALLEEVEEAWGPTLEALGIRGEAQGLALWVYGLHRQEDGELTAFFPDGRGVRAEAGLDGSWILQDLYLPGDGAPLSHYFYRPGTEWGRREAFEAWLKGEEALFGGQERQPDLDPSF